MKHGGRLKQALGTSRKAWPWGHPKRLGLGDRAGDKSPAAARAHPSCTPSCVARPCRVQPCPGHATGMLPAALGHASHRRKVTEMSPAQRQGTLDLPKGSLPSPCCWSSSPIAVPIATSQPLGCTGISIPQDPTTLPSHAWCPQAHPELGPPLTSSKKGLLPLRILVLLVCPATVTFTTGLMLTPGSCRPSMTLTRIWDGRDDRAVARWGWSYPGVGTLGGTSQGINPLPPRDGLGGPGEVGSGERLIPTSFISPGSPGACWIKAFWVSSSSASSPGQGARGACGAARGARTPVAPRRTKAPCRPPLLLDPPFPPLRPSLRRVRKRMEDTSKMGLGVVRPQGEGSSCEK